MRAAAINMPGRLLSHPANATSASKRSACMTHSTESAMISRDTSEPRIPSCPIEMPSETAMVTNSIGKPPASRTPCLARLNLPAAFLYGGSILPGHYKDQALDVVSVFEAVGACAAGTITENELGEIERRACPTQGSCAGMFTANTMSSIAEAMGM